MLKIKNVHIHNFIKIQEQTIPMDNLGIVWLRGRNMDEPCKGWSGSGKTLFGDAIHWLLGGKTTRGLKADKIIGDNDKCAFVEADVESMGNLYKIGRYRKHPEFGNNISIISGDDISKRTIAKNEDSIEKLIGSSFNLLQLSSFLVDDEKSHFSRMDGVSRSIILDEIAGTSEADAPARLKKSNAMIRDIEADILDMDSSKQIIKSQIKSLKDTIVLLNKNLNEKKDNNFAYIESLKSRINKMLSQKPDQYEVALKNYNFEYEKMQKEKKRIKELENQKTNQINEINKKIEIARNDIKYCDRDIERLLKPVKASIGSMCNKCGNKITAESIGVLESDYKKEVDAIKNKRQKFEENFSAAKEELKGLNNVSTPLFDSGAESRLLQAIASTKTALNSLQNGYKEAKELQNELDKANTSQANYYEGLKLQIIEKNKELKNKVAELRNLFYLKLGKQKEIDKLNMLSDFYSPQGFRPIVMSYYAPILSQASNYFLNDFTGGKENIIVSTKTESPKGDIKEKVDIKATQGNIIKDFPSEFCAGENGAIDISMNFGIMRLAGQNSANDFGFMFLDEITNSLSSKLIERLFIMLREKVYKPGMTIIVTTHHPVPENLFDHVWVSVRENDICRIEYEK